jgi:hypothetical protein
MLDGEIIDDLAKRLEKGEPIAARRAPVIVKAYNSEKDVAADYDNARSQLKEVPNRIMHIMTASMLRKGSYYTPPQRAKLGRSGWGGPGYQEGLLKQYCDSAEKRTVRQRLEDIYRLIHGLDLTITKSIEGTEILEFYQKKRNLHGQ